MEKRGWVSSSTGKICSPTQANFTLQGKELKGFLSSPTRDLLEAKELAWDRKTPGGGSSYSLPPMKTMSSLWKDLIIILLKMDSFISSLGRRKNTRLSKSQKSFILRDPLFNFSSLWFSQFVKTTPSQIKMRDRISKCKVLSNCSRANTPSVHSDTITPGVGGMCSRLLTNQSHICCLICGLPLL